MSKSLDISIFECPTCKSSNINDHICIDSYGFVCYRCGHEWEYSYDEIKEYILSLGCGSHRDYWGEYDCSYGYPWTCDYCPNVIEKYQGEDNEIC